MGVHASAVRVSPLPPPSHHGRLLRLHLLSRVDLGSWYPDLLTVTALVPSSSLWAFNDPRILTWVTIIAEIFVLIVVVVRTFVLLCNKSFVNSDRRRKLPERSDRERERERGIIFLKTPRSLHSQEDRSVGRVREDLQRKWDGFGP